MTEPDKQEALEAEILKLRPTLGNHVHGYTCGFLDGRYAALEVVHKHLTPAPSAPMTEAALIDAVAEEHCKRSCPQDPQPWRLKSRKEKSQHVAPSMWWLSVFKSLGLIRAVEETDKLRAELTGWKERCFEVDSRNCGLGKENAELRARIAELEKMVEGKIEKPEMLKDGTMSDWTDQ